MDENDEYENKESPSHLEQIKAKLTRWKSDNSKVATAVSSTIDKFFKQKIEPNDNIQKNHTEELIENEISTSPIKYTDPSDTHAVNDTLAVNDNEEKTDEQKQKSIKDDKKKSTYINNLKSMNIELTEHAVDNSNCENMDDTLCLKIVAEKSDSLVDIKYDSTHKSEVKNVFVKDVNINCDSSKINTNASIKIDTSIAPKERKFAVAETSLEQIQQRLSNLRFQRSEKQKIKTRFFATIDPNKNQQAEIELSREISKDMFSRVSNSILKVKIKINT